MLIQKGICYGIAALGFAILFNVPKRTLLTISLLAMAGGVTKLLLFEWGYGLVLSSLGGATVIGILSIQTAHILHAPHLVFSIPSVIPLVPGLYTYRMMIGLVSLTREMAPEDYMRVLSQTVKNGLTAGFVTLSLAVGVATPMLLTRKKSGKFVKIVGNVRLKNP